MSAAAVLRFFLRAEGAEAQQRRLVHHHRHEMRNAAARPVRQFNTLTRKLEKERALMAGWQETLPLLRNIAEQDLMPLAEAFDAHERQMVLLCDQACGHKSNDLT
jgi:hypothetical protein